MIAGVSDAGDVIGLTRAQIASLDSLLVEVSTDTIKPPVRIRTHHEELSDGKLVLLAEVPESDFVHESPGGSYIRVGASKRLMGGRRAVTACATAVAGSLSVVRQADRAGGRVQDAGRTALEAAAQRRGRGRAGASPPKAGAPRRRRRGGPARTVAGVLPCTPDPERWLPNACITATLYRGGDRASGQIDAREITGPLNEQIAGAVAFAVRNMQVAARKDPARTDLPQYSEKALFEALVNAVVHRDYSMRGGRIRLSMFDDRLEIVSPGSLPNNLSVESMTVRQATRNEALTSVLARMPVGGIRGGEDRRYFMERRGDGIPIIRRETWELCGKLPEYRVIDDSEVLLVMPAARWERSVARAVVSVRSAGRPLSAPTCFFCFRTRPGSVQPRTGRGRRRSICTRPISP